MADLPEIIDAGGFKISYTDGVRIGASNMYRGSVACNNPAMYFLHYKNIERDNRTYWYNFGFRNNNPYILRVYGKSDYFLSGGEEMELIFTEVIDYTLEDWAKNNPLLHSPNSTRLSARFIRILLDILHGLIFFRMNIKRPHGDIASHNIYIVRGRAKLANVANPRYNRGSFKHDIESFNHMIVELFRTNGLDIPLELLQLFESLLISVNIVYRSKDNANFLLNAVHHPVLLTPKQRGELRHAAFSVINGYLSPYKSRIKLYLDGEIENARIKFPFIQGTRWINNVNEGEFLEVLYYQPPPTQQPPPIQAVPKVAYDDTPFDFLRFSRNVGEYARDNYRRELCDNIKDEKLTLYWPGFLPVLHDVLTYENEFVRPLPIIN